MKHVLLLKFFELAEITTAILDAKEALDDHQLVAIPTETVYGLAANGSSEIALKKIFTAKGRPANNPLILHFKNLDAIAPYVKEISAQTKLLAENFWPGPLTLLLEKSDQVPPIVTAGSPRVAVRVPNHPITLELLKSLEYPLAAPSANPSGYISPTTAQHVAAQLGDKIPFILDGGPCTSGIESTILGWEGATPIIYRKGVITSEQIDSVLGTYPEFNTNSEVLEAPGMLSSHYAPNTPTIVTESVEKTVLEQQDKKIGLILFNENSQLGVTKEVVLSKTGSLTEMAKNLYAAMRQLDTLSLDVLIIEKAPDEGIGKAINDRLKRSSFR